uniref:Adenosine deaminase 2b n=1 Tax=Poecilia latipinna TaxID=48699 RepID=A0A3B3UKM8_9TELE
MSAEWLVKNVTYRPHCYICFTWDNSVRFLFSTLQPFPRWDCFYWQLLESLRARIGDNAGFDSSLIQHLTLFTENPDGEYPNQDVVWEKFEKAFIAAAGLITHAPVLRDYIYQGLEELHRDNVMYLELRSGLSRTYELDGTIHDKIWTLKLFQEVTSKFKQNYPEFFGARIIISVHRYNMTRSNRFTDKAKEIHAGSIKWEPYVVAGFDMVGRENSGRTLWDFREALSLPAELGASLPYFFHAGETGQSPYVRESLKIKMQPQMQSFGLGGKKAFLPCLPELAVAVSCFRLTAKVVAPPHPVVIGLPAATQRRYSPAWISE